MRILLVEDDGMLGAAVKAALENENNTVDNTPVLIITARESISQKIEGLDLGADDYLSKPFVVGELFARIRSLVRRSKGIASPTIIYKDIELDPASFLLTKNNITIPIVPKEFNILKALLENLNKIVSKSSIEEILYSWEEGVESKQFAAPVI